MNFRVLLQAAAVREYSVFVHMKCLFPYVRVTLVLRLLTDMSSAISFFAKNKRGTNAT